jgi:hypothetical protein
MHKILEKLKEKFFAIPPVNARWKRPYTELTS